MGNQLFSELNKVLILCKTIGSRSYKSCSCIFEFMDQSALSCSFSNIYGILCDDNI